MRVRGRRECADCGTRWSYYETGSITCPACGSIESVGTDDDRRLHTAGEASLDLSPVRDSLERRATAEIAGEVEAEVRRYLAVRGFIRGGELSRLDGEYVRVEELRQAAAAVRHSPTPDGELDAYFAALVRGAGSGDPETTVPDGHRAIRGRAVAAAVTAYRLEVSTWLDDHPDGTARRVLGRLRDHAARLDALDGDVPVAESDRLLAAAVALGDYLVCGADIERAVRALDDLE